MAMTPAGTYVNISERSYFKAVFSQGMDYAIGDVAVSKAVNEPTVIFAKAVKGEDGRLRAALAFEVKMTKLSAISSQIKLGKSGYGWVLDQRGLVIAHPQSDVVLSLDTLNSAKDGYKGLDALAKLMMGSDSGEGAYVRKDGVRMMTYYAKVPSSPGWVLCLSIEEEELNSTVTGLVSLLLVVLGVGIVVAVLVSI
jgi:methyl-accepting chemotaxis protein